MKKVFSSLMVMLILLLTLSTNVLASSSIDYNSELKSRSSLNRDNSISDNSVSKSDTNEIYLDSREAVSIATDFIESFYLTNDDLYFTKNEAEVFGFKNINNIPLYDVDSNLNGYFLLLPKNKYCIVDARKNGYGVLESGDNDELLQKIRCFESNERLFYVFPSMIFTEEELKEYIKNNSIDNPENLILPKPSEEINDFRKEIPSVNRYGNEVVQLTNESNFVNVANRYYGGNQSWFSEEKLKNKGCGIVAAANIANHLSKYVSGCDSLYRYKDLSKSSFLNHMYDVEKYLSPTIIGIPSLSYFEDGFESFAKSRGVNVSAYWSDNKVTKDSFANYIKSGLRRDCPVAYLQYWNSNQSDFDWHWMTITKYFRNTTNGDRYIAVSTWGERHSLNFNALWDGNLACGVLYFK